MTVVAGVKTRQNDDDNFDEIYSHETYSHETFSHETYSHETYSHDDDSYDETYSHARILAPQQAHTHILAK